MAKEIVVKKENQTAWFDAQETGMPTSSSSQSQVKLLNSMLQSKFFMDGDDMKQSDLGKFFFLGENKSQLSDLMDEFEATVIRVQRGHIVYEEVDDNRENKITSIAHELRGDEKRIWKEKHPGKKYRNQVRMLLAPYDIKTTIEMMKTNEIPFVTYTIEKSAYSCVFDLRDKKYAAIEDSEYKDYVKNVGSVIAPVFKYKFTSKVEKGDHGEYFVPEISVSLNDPKTISQFEPIFMELKDRCLFDIDPEQSKLREYKGTIVEDDQTKQAAKTPEQLLEEMENEEDD